MSTHDHRFTFADVLLLVTVVIWGVNFAVVKFALAEIPPLAFNAVRFLAVGVTLVAVMRLTGQSWRIDRRHLAGLVGLGVLGNTAYQLLFIHGADATTADNAALILATVPVWVALAGSLAGLERVDPAGWLGVALSFAGIALIILGSDRAASFRFGGATLRGDGLMLAATLCWAVYTPACRPPMKIYGALRVTGVCTLAGSVPLVLAGLPELAALDRPVSLGAWTAAVLSGVFAIGLVYFFWHYGVARLGSTRTALYTNPTPPIALLTAWLALGETLTAQQGLGSVLAITGVALARRHARPRHPGGP